MPKSRGRRKPARKRQRPTTEPTSAEYELQLPAETWEAIRDRQWELLDVMETEGQAGAMRWLDERGLAYKLTVVSVRPA